MKSAAAIVLAGLAVLSTACSRPGAAERQNGVPEVPVVTHVVQLSGWNDTLQALGTVKARESVTLTAKVSEIVEEIHFESGDEVASGAALVSLRGGAQRAALAQAQASATEAERLYERQRELASQQLIASSALDTQLAIRDAARAQVAQMRSDIGDRVVRAPFAGMVGIRQVSPGSLITPTTVIATLDDIARVFVDFQLPESALASVEPGETVTATSAAYPGRQFEGRVATVDTRVDPVTRAVTVRADFENPDRALRPGMLMDVRLFRPERQALVIPEIAVVQVGRESFVFRVGADNAVEQVAVQTGARVSGRVEIVEGVAAGDRIVTDGTGKLRPGMRIRDAATEANPTAGGDDAPAAPDDSQAAEAAPADSSGN